MKKKEKVIVSKKDIVIPKGTIFKCIDGMDTHYVNGNYEALINLSVDNCGRFVIGDEFDNKDFELKDKKGE